MLGELKPKGPEGRGREERWEEREEEGKQEERKEGRDEGTEERRNPSRKGCIARSLKKGQSGDSQT